MGIKIGGEGSWNLKDCTVADSGVSYSNVLMLFLQLFLQLVAYLRIALSPTARLVSVSLDSPSHLQIGLKVSGKSKGTMVNTLVESCSVGIDIVSGARVDISSGSRSLKVAN